MSKYDKMHWLQKVGTKKNLPFCRKIKSYPLDLLTICHKPSQNSIAFGLAAILMIGGA
jgi:hypothetical protein